MNGTGPWTIPNLAARGRRNQRRYVSWGWRVFYVAAPAATAGPDIRSHSVITLKLAEGFRLLSPVCPQPEATPLSTPSEGFIALSTYLEGVKL